MWLEMNVINTLDGGRWRKESPGEIHPLLFFHLMPPMRKHMLDLHPTTAGPAAAFPLALSTSQGAEGSVAHGSALPLLILCLPAQYIAAPHR